MEMGRSLGQTVAHMRVSGKKANSMALAHLATLRVRERVVLGRQGSAFHEVFPAECGFSICLLALQRRKFVVSIWACAILHVTGEAKIENIFSEFEHGFKLCDEPQQRALHMKECNGTADQRTTYPVVNSCTETCHALPDTDRRTAPPFLSCITSCFLRAQVLQHEKPSKLRLPGDT